MPSASRLVSRTSGLDVRTVSPCLDPITREISTNCPNYSGLDPAFTTTYAPRGNVTAIKRWRNLPTAGEETTSNQYDIAGNLVLTMDPRGNISKFDFRDNFGGPSGSVGNPSSPAELASNDSYQYAYPTAIVNAKGHTSLAQYDYYLGKPVDQADPNSVVTTIFFNDPLDRPTQVIRATGTSVANQTTFGYDDQMRIVTTTSDKDTYGDNQLRTAIEYDGLGRQKETRQYEGPGAYIISRQTPDALGRVKQVWNPFRSSGENAPPGTNTQYVYDGLSRVIAIAMPGGATTTTGGPKWSKLGSKLGGSKLGSAVKY